MSILSTNYTLLLVKLDAIKENGIELRELYELDYKSRKDKQVRKCIRERFLGK